MAGSAFFTAASGLRNHQLRIDVIANNLANVNTAGYKGSNVVFSDVLSQTIRGASAPTANLGGINPLQIGLGMQLAAIHNNMGQSPLENTGRQTDFAINGAGFFVLTNGREDIFTRAGDFNLDRDGMLIAGNGYRVQGYNQLNADGTAIDAGRGIGDITIEFGKKLEARATENLWFASNLDSASFRYGSANNETANVGTTGILTVAGAAEPWTTVVSQPVTDYVALAPVETIRINQLPTAPAWITVPADNTQNWTAEEIALETAEAINSDPTISTQVQATVREDSGDYFVVLQSVNPGTTLEVESAGAVLTGLTTGITQPPAEPSSALVGTNTITVNDAKAATGSTSVPVGIGANAPAAGDTLMINGVTVTLVDTYLPTNTAAQNAVLLANEINNTANITVTATANPNGTLTLTHNYAGEQRQAFGVVTVAGYEDSDIYIDDIASGGTVASRWGFTSMSGWDSVNFVGVVDNSVNAKAELVFRPDDGSPELVRYYEDWSYDRSTAPLAFPAFTYSESTLQNVQGAIEGSGATFPLMPGVNISIDELAAGQAVFRTEDAYSHSTSRLCYDSLGNAHNLTVTFTHVNENEWQYEVSLPEEPNINLTNTTGRITFSTDGLITSADPLPVQFTAPGASPTEIQFSFNGDGDALAGITQYAAPTTTAAREQDGYAMGVLSDFEADSSGTIIAYYTNGQRRPVAQLALATFNNPEGLDRAGATNFRETSNSGSAVLLQPGTGGAGVVFNTYIEQSNVDMALEFTGLIITERGLQANGRVFTTQDEILNEIVNLKR